MISSRGLKPARLISDHSLVHVTISLNDVDKGPGSFRANPLIETNAEYASLIRINITALLAEISGVSNTEKMQAKFNTLRRETLLKKDKNLMSEDERLQLAILLSDDSAESNLCSNLTIEKDSALCYLLSKLGVLTRTFQKQKKITTNNQITHLQNKLDRLLMDYASEEEISACQTQLTILTSSDAQVEVEKHSAFRLVKDERASKEMISIERNVSGYQYF